MTAIWRDIGETKRAAAGGEDPSRALRIAKRRVALVTAVADIAGVWSLAQVTGALSRFAEDALGCACAFLLRELVSQVECESADADAPEIGSGLIVLGMGKLGALELNYSSDIDLIVFYDPECLATEPARRAAEPLRPPCPRPGPDHGPAHRRRIRLSHRPEAPPRSRLDPAGNVGSGRRDLLRDARSELGAGGDDQGPSGGRRSRSRAAVCRTDAPVHLAQEPGFRRDPRHPLDQAADSRPSRRRQDCRRRPQHQARSGRHSRDRVFRPDAAAHLGRAHSGLAPDRD